MELAGIVCRPSVARACRNSTLKVHYPVVGGLAPAIQLAHYFAIASGSGLRAVRGPAPTCPLSIDARLVDLTARRDAAPARQEVLAWQDHALRADSHEELVAVGDGYRESTESWSELLRDLKRRGMLAPVLRIQVERERILLGLLRIDYANMQRTSRWTVSRPSLVVNNQEAAPRSSLRPQSAGFGYISLGAPGLPVCRSSDSPSGVPVGHELVPTDVRRSPIVYAADGSSAH